MREMLRHGKGEAMSEVKCRGCNDTGLQITLSEPEKPFACVYCGEDRALKLLNITADQLKIAKALDREAVWCIREELLIRQDEAVRSGNNIVAGTCWNIISWLPTFDEPKACEHGFGTDTKWLKQYVCEKCGALKP